MSTSRADSDDPPVPRQANVSVTQQLVDDVIAAGGSLRVPRRGYRDRGGVDDARRAELAQAAGKVPPGKALNVTAVSGAELQIDLVDAFGGLAPELAAVPAPAKLARYHPVVTRLRDGSDRHEVSRAAMPRALRLLQGLVEEAERRGYKVASVEGEIKHAGQGGWSGSKHGHVSYRSLRQRTAPASRPTQPGLGSESRSHCRLASDTCMVATAAA